ncbi:MAG TPA: T9SS type A sorting domain-containing protein, partial [Cytophagaceae bacterium]|nr:T9SS type A sorting domain-containing protein [Cytophagaceae bacterium]
ISGDIDKISITDLSGRVMLEKQFNGNDIKDLDASSLPEGLYLMRIANKNASGVKKIVISR